MLLWLLNFKKFYSLKILNDGIIYKIFPFIFPNICYGSINFSLQYRKLREYTYLSVEYVKI